MRRQAVLLAFVFLAPLLSWAKDAASALSPHYREWLTRDVAYIISNEEKQAFLHLASDADRDNFIERFWEVRNPTPGAPDNGFKTEHYRRLEYVNQYFGHVSHTEGWRTDMGRVYITLGEPQQRQKLLGLQKISPMEIWFYQNTNPALPPYFYVIFYQRDPTDEFRLYSPYNDGPEKLITAVVGPARSEALKIIAQDAGKDVARETLSLLPDEPVDFEGGTVSLQSDVMLATIRNLANNPISQQQLANRRQILEDVSHRIVLGEEYLDVVTVALRDVNGNTNMHYLLRLKKPEDFTVAQAGSGEGYYYAVLVTVKVLLPDGRVLLSEEKKVAHHLTNAELEDVKSKVFGYEGWLPLPPNRYKLDFQLLNLVNHTTFHSQIEVTVPDANLSTLQVSNLVAFSAAQMTSEQVYGALPFSGAGVKFTPRASQELQLVQGERLNFFYQVWDLPALREDRRGKKLEVDYVYGRIGAGDSKTIHDEIPLNQLDSGGSIVNGKRILTADLAPGNYRLVMTLRDPERQSKVFGALNFSVVTSGAETPAWDVLDDQAAEAVRNGEMDFQRATCYQGMGDTAPALLGFERAYAANPLNESFRDKLVDLYFAQQQYAKVAQLFSQHGVSSSTSEQTILRAATSLEKVGDIKKAITLMESGTDQHPGSGPLLLALAEYYRKTGELQKAAAAEKRAKKFLPSGPAS